MIQSSLPILSLHKPIQLTCNSKASRFRSVSIKLWSSTARRTLSFLSWIFLCWSSTDFLYRYSRLSRAFLLSMVYIWKYKSSQICFQIRSDQIKNPGVCYHNPFQIKAFQFLVTFSPWSTSVLCWLGVWTTTLLGQLPINRNLNNILDYLSICILFCLAEGYKCISINDAMLTKAR